MCRIWRNYWKCVGPVYEKILPMAWIAQRLHLYREKRPTATAELAAEKVDTTIQPKADLYEGGSKCGITSK